MQDDDLLSGSLLENIAVGEAQPDLERAAQAARLACIDEDIRRMPMQYLTLVGHMGSTLSGGQRQRVMIARAVYRRPRILLLDEGTAHLNDALQREVFANLAGLGMTMIAVTHDPRVLECADRCAANLNGQPVACYRGFGPAPGSFYSGRPAKLIAILHRCSPDASKRSDTQPARRKKVTS